MNLESDEGEKSISISAYGTAWVAMVEDVNGSGKPQFPRCLEWIVENQLCDGSWGDPRMFVAYDRLLSTLASVIVLTHYNLHPHKAQKGLDFCLSSSSPSLAFLATSLRSPSNQVALYERVTYTAKYPEVAYRRFDLPELLIRRHKAQVCLRYERVTYTAKYPEVAYRRFDLPELLIRRHKAQVCLRYERVTYTAKYPEVAYRRFDLPELLIRRHKAQHASTYLCQMSIFFVRQLHSASVFLDKSTVSESYSVSNTPKILLTYTLPRCLYERVTYTAKYPEVAYRRFDLPELLIRRQKPRFA
ncbi:ent-copalyl diphosphate synthase [Senna tora]|uniref:Ent-copalyl diphosphate synthase n=1 Tax=Senna tora TaxID=362788 RepID=A0A834VWZ2_9FABA|nr:ent-copalyl diphosphate synthase [Senna tora]